MVQAYWLVGRRIVDEEQRGEAKAKYGEAVLRQLSKPLSGDLGKVFSYNNLRNSGSFILHILIRRFATRCVAN